MQPSYTFIDHTADVLFTAQAPTLARLFEQCALALGETQISLKHVEHTKKTVIMLEHKDIERLLFNFLDELVFYKDAECLVYNKFEISIEAGFKLKATCYGETLDATKHDPRVDVKAVTMHLFEVKEIDGGWWAKVLLDI